MTSITRISLVVLAAHVCLGLEPSGAQDDDDPVFGAWVLNVEKSSYDPGPPPLGQTRYYAPDRDGVKATVITVNARGGETTTEYVAEYDGIEYPFRGAADADAIIMERIDRNTALATFKHGRRISGSARRIISDDGNTMTISLRIGDRINNVSVYDRTEVPFLRRNPFVRTVAVNTGVLLALLLGLTAVGYGYKRLKG